jgi:hypothetical protein
MEGGRTVTKSYAVTLPILLLWLLCWIAFAWGAVQDDAFIHLRYADNLLVHHFITYDGVHANYGASSLLYVSGLAALRTLTASPELPHAASSVMHLLLFAGLAVLLGRIARASEFAGNCGLALLLLLSTPSAVRWLDDGMETVAAASVAALLAWLIHTELYSAPATGLRLGTRFGAMIVLSSLAVLLRVELSLLCAAGFLMLTLARFSEPPNWRESATIRRQRLAVAAGRSLHLLIGCGLALGTVYASMHVLLPDTAVAKSHGIAFWFNPLHDTASTLASAFSFGAGMFVFWLLTVALAIRFSGKPSTIMLLANAPFPVLLAVSVLRGQEIQGVRYFAWTFLFSCLWNIMELGRREPTRMEVRGSKALGVGAVRPSNTALLCCFLACIALMLPVEAVVMHRVLSHRRDTLRLFESQRLNVLRARRGVAADIGYIGYFTRADLCDLSGLVNGRAAGSRSSQERVTACAATDPDFVFANLSQMLSMAPAMDFSGWQLCGDYDFTNVSRPDSHYLVVRPGIVEEVCRATGRAAEPASALLRPAGIVSAGVYGHSVLRK